MVSTDTDGQKQIRIWFVRPKPPFPLTCLITSMKYYIAAKKKAKIEKKTAYGFFLGNYYLLQAYQFIRLDPTLCLIWN